MATPHDNQAWFSDWLSRAWPRVDRLMSNEKWVDVLPVVQAVGILTGVFGFIVALVKTEKPDQYLFYVNDIGHIVLLLTALLFFLPWLGIDISGYRREGSDVVSRTAVRFQNWLYSLLFLWLLFYFCRALVDGEKVGYWSVGGYVSQASPYINVASALALFGLYLSAEYVGTPDWSAGGRIWLIIIGIFLVGILQGVADISKTESIHDQLDLIAGIFNGLIVGVATALLIGRLDSRYIGFRKGTITTLYCYALIQPLFPYVFSKGATGLEITMQYIFIAIALVMKVVLLLALGKIIDDGTLHFYISQMRWLDKHAATLRARHESTRASDSRGQRGGPYLFSLVPPDLTSAAIRIDHHDVQIELGILNAWIGVGWDIRQLKAQELQIAETKIPIKRLDLNDGEGSVRVRENDKFTLVKLDVEVNVTIAELKELLKSDPSISQAISNNQKTKRVDVVLRGLQADTSILDGREASYVLHQLESVDSRNALFYSASLELDALK